MKDKVSRRDFIKKTAAVAAIALAGPAISALNADKVFAKAKAAKKSKIVPILKSNVNKVEGKKVQWLAADSAEYKKLMLPKIHLPLIAQNGGLVPLTLDSKHPMKKGNYIKAFHVFDFNNPISKIATFNLTPENGKAYISTKLKIQQNSYVQVVTEYSDGKMFGDKKYIIVTEDGC
jgi:sulfur-oxidizing protein SoxY